MPHPVAVLRMGRGGSLPKLGSGSCAALGILRGHLLNCKKSDFVE